MAGRGAVHRRALGGISAGAGGPAGTRLERQTDIADNGLFYDGRLTAARYRAWLRRLAVHYVAVGDAPADYSARMELKLIEGGLAYLRPVAHLRHWTVYRVDGAAPLASGVARVTEMGPNSISLLVARPGDIYLRVRWNSYWRLTGIRGCVAPAGNFTRIEANGSGRAQLVTSFSIGRIGQAHNDASER